MSLSALVFNPPATVEGWLNLLVDKPSIMVLTIAHAVLNAHKLRQGQLLNHNVMHPLGGLVAFLLINFAGSIAVGLLLSTPFSFLQDDTMILLSAIIWYLMFFSPGDIVYRIADVSLVRLVTVAIVGVRSAHKVMHAVDHAQVSYPNSWIAGIVCAVLSVHASSVAIRIDKAVRHVPTVPGSFFTLRLYANGKLTKVCCSTKMTLLCAFLYTVSVDHTHSWDGLVPWMSLQGTKLIILIFQLSANILAAFNAPTFDPFLSLTAITYLLFGVPPSPNSTSRPDLLKETKTD